MISRADLLGDALLEEREALGQPQGGDGFGVGFYQAGEVLHRKRPQRIDERIDWNGMLDGIRAHVAVAHVRDANGSERRAENTHPFRMGRWLFAHVGELSGHHAIRDRLLETMPDFLQRNIRGTTDSELLFHVVLSFLHDSGQLESVDVTNAAVASALRSTVTLADRHAREVGAPLPGMTSVLTNGRQLYALQRGAPLSYVVRDRLPRRDSDAPARTAESVRYVLVTTPRSGEALPADYSELQEHRLLCVDRDLRTELLTLAA
jgi:glutamine amidotransferase